MQNLVAFVAEIKSRFQQRFIASLSLQRGGTERSLYFSSLFMLPPEDYHNFLLEDDDVGVMKHE